MCTFPAWVCLPVQKLSKPCPLFVFLICHVVPTSVCDLKAVNRGGESKNRPKKARSRGQRERASHRSRDCPPALTAVCKSRSSQTGAITHRRLTCSFWRSLSLSLRSKPAARGHLRREATCGEGAPGRSTRCAGRGALASSAEACMQVGGRSRRVGGQSWKLRSRQKT